jgi:hypothetical protein
MSQSVLYFPIINYRYVRKKDIFDLTSHRVSENEINKMLTTIESECNNFRERQRIDAIFSKFTRLFPYIFILSTCTLFGSSFLSFKSGVFYGSIAVFVSFLFLLVLIMGSFKYTSIEEKYRKLIEQRIVKLNRDLEPRPLRWEVGQGNILELYQREDVEFKEYDEDQEDRDATNFNKRIKDFIRNQANSLATTIQGGVQQLDIGKSQREN